MSNQRKVLGTYFIYKRSGPDVRRRLTGTFGTDTYPYGESLKLRSVVDTKSGVFDVLDVESLYTKVGVGDTVLLYEVCTHTPTVRH